MDEDLFQFILSFVVEAHRRNGNLKRDFTLVAEEFAVTGFSCDQEHGQELAIVTQYLRDEVIPRVRELSPSIGQCEQLMNLKDMN